MRVEDFLKAFKPGDPAPAFLIGKIPATYASGHPKLVFDGESLASTRTYPYLSSYTPAANDRVLVAMVGHCWVVIGKIV